MIKARKVVYEYYRRDENNEIIGSEKAIDGVSFDIKDGEIFAFIGHNGAGKTTMIKSIIGIFDFDSGDIIINIILLNLTL